MANLPVRGERNNLDWDNPQQVAAQMAKVPAIARELREHNSPPQHRARENSMAAAC